MTRMFFGCVGPTFTSISTATVAYTATNLTLDSQIAPRSPAQLPNGATVQSTE